MKMINRLIYGKTDTPKYIKRKRLWLYKDEWHDLQSMTQAYTKDPYQKISSPYYYTINGVTHYVADFDSLMAQLLKTPWMEIESMFELGKREIITIQALRCKIMHDAAQDYRNSLERASAKIQDIFKGLGN